MLKRLDMRERGSSFNKVNFLYFIKKLLTFKKKFKNEIRLFVTVIV